MLIITFLSIYFTSKWNFIHRKQTTPCKSTQTCCTQGHDPGLDDKQITLQSFFFYSHFTKQNFYGKGLIYMHIQYVFDAVKYCRQRFFKYKSSLKYQTNTGSMWLSYLKDNKVFLSLEGLFYSVRKPPIQRVGLLRGRPPTPNAHTHALFITKRIWYKFYMKPPSLTRTVAGWGLVGQREKMKGKILSTMTQFYSLPCG